MLGKSEIQLANQSNHPFSTIQSPLFYKSITLFYKSITVIRLLSLVSQCMPCEHGMPCLAISLNELIATMAEPRGLDRIQFFANCLRTDDLDASGVLKLVSGSKRIPRSDAFQTPPPQSIPNVIKWDMSRIVADTSDHRHQNHNFFQMRTSIEVPTRNMSVEYRQCF